LISLLVGELFSILIYKAPPVRELYYDSYLGWYPRPGAAGWNTESGKFVKKSSTGFNDFNLNNSIIRDCTINFFGDSMTEGFQFSADNTFSTILENNLPSTSSCTEFRVNNFGVSATGTFQQSRIMEVLGKKYPASRSAIFLFLGNDLANNLYDNNLPYKPGISLKDGVATIIESNYSSSNSKVKKYVTYFSDYSNFARLIIGAIISVNHRSKNYSDSQKSNSDLKNMGIVEIPETIETQLLALEKSLTIAKQIAQNQKTQLTIFYIPTGQEVALGNNQALSQIKSKINVFCDDLSIRCIDLLPNMEKGTLNVKISPYHLNGVNHLNQKGHKKIASILVSYYKD
jgi:hypothetical protein